MLAGAVLDDVSGRRFEATLDPGGDDGGVGRVLRRRRQMARRVGIVLAFARVALERDAIERAENRTPRTATRRRRWR